MNTIYLLLACAAVVAIAAGVCWIGERRDKARAKAEAANFEAELKRLDDEIKISLR